MALSCVSTVQHMVIAFQIGAIINLQRFQLGEASHGFLSGQMQQAIAIPLHRLEVLAIYEHMCGVDMHNFT